VTTLPPCDAEFVGSQKCIAIIRGRTVAHFADTARTMVQSGIRLLEFPLTTAGVCDVLPHVVAEHRDTAYVGAGTVTTLERAQAAHEAGAQFLVTPNLDLAVVDYARKVALPIFVGALTPTEIHSAWQAGATAIKLFPASIGGPTYLEELRGGPFPDIPLIPTGGVDNTNAQAYLNAGALALGMGSALLGSAPNGGSQEELRVRIADFRNRTDR
jgi:2-dehydro-3-deoxyphosphogluconate aldolase/(4S)-4-hydroxy-2-oxoglutarate aldolase